MKKKRESNGIGIFLKYLLLLDVRAGGAGPQSDVLPSFSGDVSP